GVWPKGWGCFYSYFSTVLFLLLVVTISHCLGLKCKEHQYPFSGKCCKDCAPGRKQLDENIIQM
uniref:Uncharacterized protein n=1 Tax=Buteo japonicus TaxID=224669 RepID=A0A8B9Z9J8_9AVES